MTDYLAPIATFFISLYFFYRLKTQKENRGLNGFSAGVFLVISIYKLAPIATRLISLIVKPF